MRRSRTGKLERARQAFTRAAPGQGRACMQPPPRDSVQVSNRVAVVPNQKGNATIRSRAAAWAQSSRSKSPKRTSPRPRLARCWRPSSPPAPAMPTPAHAGKCGEARPSAACTTQEPRSRLPARLREPPPRPHAGAPEGAHRPVRMAARLRPGSPRSRLPALLQEPPASRSPLQERQQARTGWRGCGALASVQSSGASQRAASSTSMPVRRAQSSSWSRPIFGMAK